MTSLRELSGRDDTYMLFPELTCETAVNAAIFAGYTPRFCDVNQNDYLMSAHSAEQVLATEPIGGIVATHIFGHLLDTHALQTITNDSVPIIEDAAQGYGGMLHQRKAGSMGLASVVSFGDGKLIDCGSGGALLTDDLELATRCRRVLQTLQATPELAAEQRTELMKQMMLARRQFRGNNAALVRHQRTLLRTHKTGYLAACETEVAEKILRAMKTIDVAVDARIELMNELDAILQDNDRVSIPMRQGLPALWRYTVCIDSDIMVDTIKAMKQYGLVVSKLFKPCTVKFSEDGVSYPQARNISSNLVNIHMFDNRANNDNVISAMRRVFS